MPRSNKVAPAVATRCGTAGQCPGGTTGTTWPDGAAASAAGGDGVRPRRPPAVCRPRLSQRSQELRIAARSQARVSRSGLWQQPGSSASSSIPFVSRHRRAPLCERRGRRKRGCRLPAWPQERCGFSRNSAISRSRSQPSVAAVDRLAAGLLRTAARTRGLVPKVGTRFAFRLPQTRKRRLETNAGALDRRVVAPRVSHHQPGKTCPKPPWQPCTPFDEPRVCGSRPRARVETAMDVRRAAQPPS